MIQHNEHVILYISLICIILYDYSIYNRPKIKAYSVFIIYLLNIIYNRIIYTSK